MPPSHEEIEEMLEVCEEAGFPTECTPEPISERRLDHEEEEEAGEEAGEEEEEHHAGIPHRGIVRCMVEHQDELSGECAELVSELPALPPRRHQRGDPAKALRTHCTDEASELCSEGEGARDVVACLLEAPLDDISPSCDDVLALIEEMIAEREQRQADGSDTGSSDTGSSDTGATGATDSSDASGSSDSGNTVVVVSPETEGQDGTVPVALSFQQFMEVEPEHTEDGDHDEGEWRDRNDRRRFPVALVAAGAGIAFVALAVVAAVLIVRRRRAQAARRTSLGRTRDFRKLDTLSVASMESRQFDDIVTKDVVTVQGKPVNGIVVDSAV